MTASPGAAAATAFRLVGNDSTAAIQRAREYSDVSLWIDALAAQSAIVGATAMAIPGVHLAASVGDLAFLLNRCAYGAWGIGEIRKCVVLGMLDIRNILSVWLGRPVDQLPHRAIKIETLRQALAMGQARLGSLSMREILAHMSDQQLALVGTTALDRAMRQGGPDVVLDETLSAAIAVKFGSRFAAKGVAGFVPLIGPIISAAVNARLLREIMRAADDYYRRAM
jgi:hypothetical protein